MEQREVEIRRSELYEEVWSIPMRTLAKKYGLSDVGLAKICKKHNIPRPSRGYWRKKESGARTKQMPLPPKDSDEVIEIHANPFHESNCEKMETALEEVAPKELEEPIIVFEELRKPHSLVRQSSEFLKSTQPDPRGLLIPRQDICLDIKVSKNSLRRALLIMDALLKALEQRGFKIRLSGKATEVWLLDVSLEFSISEQLVRERKEPKDHDFNGYYSFGHSRFEEQSVPSGILCLSINSGYWSHPLQQNWRDGKIKKLENCLNAFVRGLIKIAIGKKEDIQKKQQEEREELERQRRWEEQKRQAEVERRKFERLMKHVENWNKSRRIREYLSVLEEKASSGTCSLKFEDGLENWLKWAKSQADRLDPFSPSYKPPVGSKDNSEGGEVQSKDYFSPWFKSFGSL